MNELETIENYLAGQLTANERMRFETALRTDPALAESMAFYLSAQDAARSRARRQRKAELDALRQPAIKPAVVWTAPMRWAAAACMVLALGLGWYLGQNANNQADTAQLANAYIQDSYGQLSTTMGGAASQLDRGIDLYNHQQFAEAEAIFAAELTAQSHTAIPGGLTKGSLKRQPVSDRVLTFAGLAALKQHKYDTAIDRFHELGQRTDLFSNPGLFLEALARLQRNEPMDKEQAKKLLDDVIDRNLEGKAEAKKISLNL